MDEKELDSNEGMESPGEGQEFQESAEKRSAKGDRIARKLQSSYAFPYASPEVLANILKAYVIASGQGTEAVKYADAAAVAAIHPTSVSRNNAFLAESGLIVSERYGSFRPSPEAIEYAKRAPWHEEEARRYIRQAINGTWYGDTVRQQLQMHSQLTREKIIRAFGIKTGADQADSPRLGLLLDFLTYFGYVVEDEAGNYLLNPETEAQDASIVIDDLAAGRQRVKEWRDKHGDRPTRSVDEAIAAVVDGQSPAAVVDRMLVPSPVVRGGMGTSITANITINVSVTPSMTDLELQSLAEKARRLLLLLSNDSE